MDAQRIALWGTSFGGGHVLATAGQLGGNISAVVAQVPHLSGSGAILQARAILHFPALSCTSLHFPALFCVC